MKHSMQSYIDHNPKKKLNQKFIKQAIAKADPKLANKIYFIKFWTEDDDGDQSLISSRVEVFFNNAEDRDHAVKKLKFKIFHKQSSHFSQVKRFTAECVHLYTSTHMQGDSKQKRKIPNRWKNKVRVRFSLLKNEQEIPLDRRNKSFWVDCFILGWNSPKPALMTPTESREENTSAFRNLRIAHQNIQSMRSLDNGDLRKDLISHHLTHSPVPIDFFMITETWCNSPTILDWIKYDRDPTSNPNRASTRTQTEDIWSQTLPWAKHDWNQKRHINNIFEHKIHYDGLHFCKDPETNDIISGDMRISSQVLTDQWQSVWHRCSSNGLQNMNDFQTYRWMLLMILWTM